MSISAAQVKELRNLSGAGMMDCKIALEESNGDMDAAIDWLRKKGISKADKKSGRTAAEGLISVADKGHKAVIVEVNSETDFVARNEDFQALASKIANVALNTEGDLNSILSSQYSEGKNVEESIRDTIATIGENLQLRRSAGLEVNKGVVATYIHNAVSEGLGKIGVLVAIETEGDVNAAKAFGRQVAMHIAAVNPLALHQQDVDVAIVEREKAIFVDQARASGKPDNIIEKMVEGRIRKFYEEVVLLAQSFVVNPDHSVQDALKEAEKTIGAPAKITGFVRFALGEGIEKVETNFAQEVATAAKA